MPTTIHLPTDLEQSLHQHCAATKRSMNEVVREALRAYLTHTSPPPPALHPSAWTLGADVFGRHDGPADLSGARRQYAAQVWDEKHIHHTTT